MWIKKIIKKLFVKGCKHEYNYGDKFPLAECVYCGRTTGLSGWQLNDMPAIGAGKDISEITFCSKSNKPVYVWQDSVNCLK